VCRGDAELPWHFLAHKNKAASLPGTVDEFQKR